MRILLDGDLMKTKEEAHEYIGQLLKVPDHYGHNLDALWDLVSTISSPIEIRLINKEKLIDYLGYYGEHLILVFEDAMDENKNIIFTSED